MKKKTKVILRIAIPVAVIAAFAGIYAGGRSRYETHFLPGTYINGHSVSNMTAEKAKEQLADDIENYKITLKERNGETESLSSADVGLSYQNEEDTDELLKNQDAAKWFMELSGKKDLKVVMDFEVDDAKLDAAVKGLNAFKEENMVAPTDSSIVFENNTFSVKDGTEGSLLKTDETLAAVKQAILDQKKSLDLNEAGLYQTIDQPADKEALQQQVDTYNGWLNATQSYQLRGKTYTADQATIAGWIIQNGDGTYDLDSAKVKKFVDQMAYETDTFGLARDFTTHSGRTIRLAGGGDYGWAMDEDKTTASLIAAIKTGQANDNAQAEYQYGAQDRGVNDIGGTYVEVNISQQKMWAYVNGQQIVETDVVTGNESAGMATPSGSCWAIDAKKSPDHFKSTNVDVTFWLPFNGGCGIHDASWRSSYGGDIYKTDGSHGCVNTPYAAAQTIYNAMEIGYPVVVYYSEDQPVGPQPTQEVTGG